MPTIADFFPSKYLRAADLKGKAVTATIDKVSSYIFENDGRKAVKPVISFKEDSLKDLVCNKTNAQLIAKLYGDDTDNWSGKKIGLAMELTAFKGNVTESIRVKQPAEFNDSVDF
jgi:hypothetical protein